MVKTKRLSTYFLTAPKNVKEKRTQTRNKSFLTKSEGCRDGRLAMGLSLAHNVNQQEGKTIDWLVDHASLHQWQYQLCWSSLSIASGAATDVGMHGLLASQSFYLLVGLHCGPVIDPLLI